MNERELIASLVKSLVWPITVLVVLLVLREPVAGFIARLKRIKYGQFEAEAEAEVRTAERLIRGELGPALVAEAPSTTLQYYKNLAQVSPRASILEAWTLFETEAQSIALELGILKPGEAVVFPRIFGELLRAELLTADEVAILTRFRELRNKVAHNSQAMISPETALRYAAVLQRITDRLKKTAPDH